MEKQFLDYLYPNESFNPKENTWFLNPMSGMWGLYESTKKHVVYKGNCGVNENGKGRFYDLVCVENELFFIPGFQDGEPCIGCYNLLTETMIEIPLKKLSIHEENKNDPLFIKGFIYEEYVYMYGYSYPAIVRIHRETKKVDYIEEWSVYVNNQGIFPDEYGYNGFVSRQYVIKERKILIPFAFKRLMLCVDVDTLEEELIDIDSESEGYSSMLDYDESRILLAGTGKNEKWVYLWNVKKRQIEQKCIQERNPNILGIKYMLKSESGDIYLFPWQNWIWTEQKIYRLISKEFKLEEDCELVVPSINQEDCLWGEGVVLAGWKDKNILYYLTGADFLWHEYNIENKEYKEFKVKADETNERFEQIVNDYYRDLVKYGIPLGEKNMALDRFLNCFCYKL